MEIFFLSKRQYDIQDMIARVDSSLIELNFTKNLPSRQNLSQDNNPVSEQESSTYFSCNYNRGLANESVQCFDPQ